MTRKKQESGQHDAAKEADKKRARSRRLVLKSIVGGGALTTVKSLPEKWSRPMIDTVMLPAHAQSSLFSDLICSVEGVVADTTGGDPGTIQFDPGAPPVAGGSNTTVDQFFDSTGGDVPLDVTITLSGISATIDPSGAGDITLTLTPGGDFDLDTPAGPFDVDPDGSGAANFGAVGGDLDVDMSSTGNLELRFSAPGASDCVINFTFEEGVFSPKAGGP